MTRVILDMHYSINPALLLPTVDVFCEFCVRSGLIPFKGVGVSRSRLPASFVPGPVDGPSLPSVDMLDHSRGRCSHAPLPESRAVFIGSHVREFAAPSWAGARCSA